MEQKSKKQSSPRYDQLRLLREAKFAKMATPTAPEPGKKTPAPKKRPQKR